MDSEYGNDSLVIQRKIFFFILKQLITILGPISTEDLLRYINPFGFPIVWIISIVLLILTIYFFFVLTTHVLKKETCVNNAIFI